MTVSAVAKMGLEGKARVVAQPVCLMLEGCVLCAYTYVHIQVSMCLHIALAAIQ